MAMDGEVWKGSNNYNHFVIPHTSELRVTVNSSVTLACYRDKYFINQALCINANPTASSE